MELVREELPFFCPKCASPRPDSNCWKCSTECRVPPSGWVNPKTPPIKRIIELGKSCGYNIAVHGSLQRDLDLVAIPWVVTVTSVEMLIKSICDGIEARQIGEVEQKPHGRIAVTLQINGWFKPIDLSIMPAIK